MFLSKPDLPDQ